MKFLSSILLLMFLAGCQTADWAPFYENKQSENVEARRILGPIYEKVEFFNGHKREALRPFWSYEKSGDLVAEDFFWPLATSRRDGDYYKSHCLSIVYNNGDLSDPKSAYNFWAMPFWYQGRDRDGQDYKALFPIWGEVRDVMGFDLLKFGLFPLYLYAEKGDQHSHAYLWPFISHTKGKDLEKFRYFPFYGKLVKAGSHTNSFVMWPFWHEGHSLNEKKPGSWFLAWPFYGHYKYEDSEKYTVLWPFISWDKSEKSSSLHAPWPFYTERETADGKEESISVWPFYSHSYAPGKIRKSYLWPIATHSRLGDEKTYEERMWILPFYWDLQKVKDGVVEEEYQRYWPFMSIDKVGGRKSIKFLSLWPQRNMPSIERNWEAIWELYRFYEDESVVSHDLLWGAGKYRVERKKDESEFSVFPFVDIKNKDKKKSWNILKGIVGRREINDKELEYKVLWFLKWKVKR